MGKRTSQDVTRQLQQENYNEVSQTSREAEVIQRSAVPSRRDERSSDTTSSNSRRVNAPITPPSLSRSTYDNAVVQMTAPNNSPGSTSHSPSSSAQVHSSNVGHTSPTTQQVHMNNQHAPASPQTAPHMSARDNENNSQRSLSQIPSQETPAPPNVADNAVHAPPFTLKQGDLGPNMVLRGLASEDIPTMMRENRSRVEIDSQDQCTPDVIDRPRRLHSLRHRNFGVAYRVTVGKFSSSRRRSSNPRPCNLG